MNEKNEAPKRKRLVDDVDFWRDEEGQAMAEFVICVPILLLIMLSIVWIYDYQDFHQDAIMEARRANWAHVLNVNAGGGQASDQFSGALGIMSIRNSIRIFPLVFPDTPDMRSMIGFGEACLVLNTPVGIGGNSIFDAASLPIDNYHISSGPAFTHENPWNRILFSIGGIFSERPEVGSAGSWPPPESVSLPNENFPMISHSWEAINHRTHTWHNSFTKMEEHIDGGDVWSFNITKGLEVSSTMLGFAPFFNWYINPMCSSFRSPVHKFNEENFDFVRGAATPGLGWPFGGDPREYISEADDGKNPLTAVNGNSRIREIIRPGG